jgi:putative ABC transport system permease protein
MRAAEPGGPPPGLGIAERCFAVLMIAYSRDFRRRYGAEAQRLFRDRYRDEYRAGGWAAVVSYGFLTLGNVTVNGALERWSNRAPRKGSGFVSTVISDIRYALRALRHNPGFTTAAVLALALGIGANTAIFTLINGVLLSALPYGDPDTLLIVVTDPTEATGAPTGGVAPADLIDWRRDNDVFEAIGAHRNASLGFTALERPVVPLTQEVTVNYFDVLQVEPLLGRTFQEGDDVAGSRVVVVSHRIWQSALAGDPDVIGKTVELDEQAWTVIGVLRPDFYSTNVIAVQPDLWIPLLLDGQESNRTLRSMIAFGRLRDGVTLDQADENMRAVAARIAAEYPATNSGWSAQVMPIRDRVLGGVQQVFLVLLAAVGFVLLIACANVANLILARSAERSREVGLRVALGASRARLVQQLVTESVVLAIIATAVAVAVAIWGIDALVAMIPASTGLPFLEQVSIDGTVLAFSFALSFLTGGLCALAPAAQLGGGGLAGSMKSGGRGHSGGRTSRRLRNALVVSEFALSLVLLFGAALMLQTFLGLRGYETGFDADELLHMRSSLRGRYQTSPDAIKSYFAELTRRLQELPGVVSVSGVSTAPPIVPFLSTQFRVPGMVVEAGQEPAVPDRRVLPGYFDTMGIPLLRGRLFDERDVEDGQPVAIVNEAFARRFFPGEDLDRMSVTPMNDRERRVVGIVGNVRAAGIDPTPPPVLYTPYDQRPIPIMSLVVRTENDPLLLARAAEETAWGMGSDMNVYQVEPMSVRLDDDSWRQRFTTQLIGAFALLALVLGAAGIYSVLTYAVTERTREIGVRVALGARRGGVVAMVVGDGLKLALLGAVIGLLGSLALGRVIAGLLYDVSATDPLTLALVTALLLAVAVVACLVPALRATRVDPVVALRAS